jgi:hypothetical protein
MQLHYYKIIKYIPVIEKCDIFHYQNNHRPVLVTLFSRFTAELHSTFNDQILDLFSYYWPDALFSSLPTI